MHENQPTNKLANPEVVQHLILNEARASLDELKGVNARALRRTFVL